MPKPSSNIAFNKAQFETLFKTHFQHLCRFAQQYVNDVDSAQEICQKVFIKLWETHQSIDPKQSVKSYLFTAVKNRCLNHIRDNKKYRSKTLDLDCGDFDLFSADDYFAEEELTDRIEAALSILPAKCRLVFEMSRFREMKYKEIAAELDISQKTVEAHISKAMKNLREQLKDYLWLFLIILGI